MTSLDKTSSTNIYSRRNPYRRPSALGVPSKHDWDATEYDKNFLGKSGEKQAAAKTEDNLKYDGLNFAENTTNKTDYTELDGKRSEKTVPDDKLKYDGLSFDKGTENGEYKQYDSKRETFQRKGDNLKQDGDLEKDTETGTRYKGEGGKKSEKYNPDDKLNSDGLSFEKGTENGEYKEYDSKRERYEKKGDNLKQDGDLEKDTESGTKYRGEGGQRSEKYNPDNKLNYDGLSFDKGTENGEYKRYDAKKERFEKRGDNLKQDGDLEKNTETGTRFQGKTGKRSEKYNPDDKLDYEGLSFEKGTEHGEYQKYDAKKERYEKRGDNLKQNGDLEKDTETGTRYQGKSGKRSEKYNPNDKLDSEGLSFENGTEQGEYKKYDAKKERYEKQGDNLKQSGDLRKDTETGTRYQGKSGKRSEKYNPDNKLDYEGLSFEKGTEHGEYQKYDAKKEKYEKRGDNLKQDGDLEKDTETGTRYKGKSGERSEKYKPDNKLDYEGLSFEKGTENGEYREHNTKRETYEKRGDNLRQDGDIEKDTETGIRYQGKTGKRSEKYSPNDKLDSEGLSFEKGTEHGEFREHDAKKEIYGKRGDNLQQNGDLEKDTETGIKYRGDKGERREIHAPDDKLYYDGLSFEKGTEQGEFKEYDAKKERYSKKGDNLKPDGDLEKDTETGIRYRGEGGQRSEKYSPDNKLSYDGLSFEKGTENGEYQRHEAKKEIFVKKGDNLMPDGDIEKYTETGKKFTAKHGRRSTAAKRNGNLQTLEGDLEKDSETHDRFSVKKGRRQGLIKRSAHIKPTGLDFEKGSENSKYMNDMKVEKPKKYTIKSNLRPSEGRLDGDSEQKDEYQVKHGRRASNAKPKTAVKSTGLEFKNGTENNEYLKGMKPEKQPRFISVANLNLAQGDLSKLTEYTGRYTTAARKGTSRAKFKIQQELTTPYGNLAGSAVRLGDKRRYNLAAVSV